MSTITVLDSTGTAQTVAKVASTGQTTSANSLPVVIASDQSNLPVAVVGTVPVSGTFWQTTQPVSIASLPALSAGAAAIGTVGVTALPALPAGGNVIGAVTQSGTWNIGTITTLPALPAGANTIGIVNQGTGATLANSWPHKLSDGTNGPVAVKPASTAAVATDPALVVAVSPNNTVAVSASALPLPAGAATATNVTTVQQTTSAGQANRSVIVDSTTGVGALVQAFHNADNQMVSGSSNGIFTGGVAQIINIANNLDRQRETGADSVPAQGISAGAANFAQAFKTSVAATIAIGTQTVTPGAMSGTIGGVAWSIQVGSVLNSDTGANNEKIVVTAVTSTTFTAVFAKTHAVNSVLYGFVYNQERDAAGEADGATGIGTAVAAEYEYNGGAPGGGNFDRARSRQAKARTTATISSGGTQTSTILTLSAAPTGLKAGGQILAYKSANFPTAGYFETLYVDLSYVEGSATVPLASAIQLSVTYDTISFDAFGPLGPQLNGFTVTGVGIEEEALYDPVSGLYFIERAATQDAVSAQNVVMENPSLFNGTTVDRGRSIVGAVSAGNAGTGTMAVEEAGRLYANITSATTTVVKSAKGFLHGISVNTAVANATITVYDNTSAAAPKIQTITLPATIGNPFVMVLDIAFQTGLTIVTSAATDITAIYR